MILINLLERSTDYEYHHNIHDDFAMKFLLNDNNFYEFKHSFLLSNYKRFMAENFNIR